MDSPTNILIVENDLLTAEMLKEMLTELNYTVCGIAKNYALAIARLQTDKSINLCFLDINLESDKNGLDIAKEINEKYKIPFVFLTSYSDTKTIKEAASYNPETYLVKPFSQTDLITTIEIIAGRKNNTVFQEKSAYYIIKDGNENIKINTGDIKWLKSDNVYVEIMTLKKRYIVRTSLEKLLDELKETKLVRTHRSFAVNLKYVDTISNQYVLMDTEKIPLSRKYKEDLKKTFYE